MTVAAAVLLGIVQGLTEFLPVSSSGHLAIAQHFLPGFEQPGVLFDVVLHLGTLGAVILYLRREVALLLSGLVPGGAGEPGRRLILLLVIGTVPAVVAALTVGDFVERSFESLGVVGLCLLLTGGLLLLSTRFRSAGRGLEGMRMGDAAVVGLLQSVALLPGISRSGTTIVAGLGRGLEHGSAARFSFLLSIPAILGAAVFKMGDAAFVPGDAVFGYVAGFATAFAVGYVAIGVVIKFLASRKFHLFGYYCLAMGGAVLVYVALGHA